MSVGAGQNLAVVAGVGGLDFGHGGGGVGLAADAAKDAAGVSEGGIPAAQAKGVKFLRLEYGAAVYEIRSGRYSFLSRR